MCVQMVTINESYVSTNQQQSIGFGTTKLFQIHTGDVQFVQQILFNVTSFVDHDILLSPTCSQTFPSKWESLPFSRSEHERGEHRLQRGIAHDSLVFIRQTLRNSNCKLNRPPCSSHCPTSRAKNCVHRKPIQERWSQEREGSQL